MKKRFFRPLGGGQLNNACTWCANITRSGSRNTKQWLKAVGFLLGVFLVNVLMMNSLPTLFMVSSPMAVDMTTRRLASDIRGWVRAAAQNGSLPLSEAALRRHLAARLEDGISDGQLFASPLAVFADNTEHGYSIVSGFDKCMPSARRITLLIAIVSTVTHFEERDHFRKFWEGYGKHAEFVVVFFLARHRSARVQRLVEREAQRYGDIIQADFTDHYRNITRKVATAFHFVSTLCRNVDFFMKLDDDLYLNVATLLQDLRYPLWQTTLRDKIFCFAIRGRKPYRVAGHKWYIAYEEYPHEYYPTYCNGWYVMPRHVAKTLYLTSQHVKYFPMDDSYFSGVVAYYANISHVSKLSKTFHRYSCRLPMSYPELLERDRTKDIKNSSCHECHVCTMKEYFTRLKAKGN